jgi:hypothetical protein
VTCNGYGWRVNNPMWPAGVGEHLINDCPGCEECLPPAREVVQHICDYRCRGESGHHDWPSPAAESAAPSNSLKLIRRFETALLDWFEVGNTDGLSESEYAAARDKYELEKSRLLHALRRTP